MINANFDKLGKNYLFSEVARRVAAYKAENPGADVISLGIGDVTQPLAAPVVAAMTEASAGMGRAETFRGYSPDNGYPFLRAAIGGYYRGRGIDIGDDEIVVSDGAKSDCANILDIFERGITALIPDPVYPVYLDTNVMAGNSVRLVAGTDENGFTPHPPKERADIVYICSPNNPTGAVFSRALLSEWVGWVNENGAVILFDAAYEAFVSDPSLPRSIFEIDGARTCAIELCSLSKTAGFTGVRCGYTVIPRELERDGASLLKLWQRRQATKFNGVGYVVQRAAEAVFSPEGLAATRAVIDIYRGNARVLASALDALALSYTGGKDSPYLWLKTPGGMPSWDFFDRLLHEANLVGTPGAGFGAAGEGRFRLTAFGSPERTLEAADRLKNFRL